MKPTAREHSCIFLEATERQLYRPRSRRSCLHDTLGSANLPLDLLPRPSSSVNGARLELTVRPSLLDHCRDPVLPESIGQLAVGVRIREIAVRLLAIIHTRASAAVVLPDNAHRGPHQCLAPVGIIGDVVEQLEDGLHIGLEDAGCAIIVSVPQASAESSQSRDHLLFSLVFIAPIMPPHASMIPSRSEIT